VKSISKSTTNPQKIELLILGISLDSKTKAHILTTSTIRTRLFQYTKPIQFAQAINYLGSFSKAKYLYICNCDTMLGPRCLDILSSNLKSSTVGITGPLVHSLQSRRIISPFDTPIKLLDKYGTCIPYSPQQLSALHSSTPVSSVSGCGLLVKANLFRSLSGFDQKFIIYWEDTDLCIRAISLGYTIILCPKAKIWHFHSATMAQSNEKHYQLYRSHTYFFLKHTNLLGRSFFMIKQTLFLIAKVAKYIFRRSSIDLFISRGILNGVKIYLYPTPSPKPF
jgi:GT2 family glycosyltransferase